MPISNIEVNIYKNVEELSREVANRFIQLAIKTIRAKGRFYVALSGGKTPKIFYSLLSLPENQKHIEWNNVYVFWSDERFVPYTYPESNFGLAQKNLFTSVHIPPTNIFPVLTERISVHESAEKYAQTIVEKLGPQSQFDLILLGIGSDGHTASLFPNTAEVRNPSGDLVIAVKNTPKPPRVRISFTWKLINNAKNIIFSVTGEDKAEALRNILNGPQVPVQFPAQGVKPKNGNLVWLVDKSAASKLDN